MEPPPAAAPSGAAVGRARAGAPSAELLEFLGEFSDGDGGWIDPLELDDLDAAEPAAPRSGDD